MLAYDWMWWGQLTNQNLARRYMEVRGGVQRCARRCAEVCAKVRREVRRGAWRGVTPIN